MKEIYERLGINTDISIERSKFNNRINLVAKNISDLLDSEDYELIDHQISFRLGSEDDFIDFLTTADFNETLLWCEMTLNALSENNKRAFVHLQKMITQAIDESAIDLGVAYKNGKFYRTGAKELDQTLVIETLDWLIS